MAALDARVENALADLYEAECSVRAKAFALSSAIAHAIERVFETAPDLDAVELTVDADEGLNLRAAFRGAARFDAWADTFEDPCDDCEFAEAAEDACDTLGELHAALRRSEPFCAWVSGRIEDGATRESLMRFWTRDYAEGGDYPPGTPLTLVSSRYIRAAARSTYPIVAYVGPSGLTADGLDVVKPGGLPEALCLRYTRGALGPHVRPRQVRKG